MTEFKKTICNHLFSPKTIGSTPYHPPPTMPVSYLLMINDGATAPKVNIFKRALLPQKFFGGSVLLSALVKRFSVS